MANYIKVTRNIIYDTSLPDKRVLLWSYLQYKKNMDNIVGYSISNISKWTGYKPDSRPNKINEQYENLISLFAMNNYFEKYETEKFTSNSYRELKLNFDIFNPINNYVCIVIDEIEQILNHKSTNTVPNSILLLVYCYIKININIDSQNPKCCYRYYNTIANDLGISEYFVPKCITELTNLGMICVKETKKSAISAGDRKIYLPEIKIFALSNIWRWEGNLLIKDSHYDPYIELDNQMKLLYKKGKNFKYEEQVLGENLPF